MARTLSENDWSWFSIVLNSKKILSVCIRWSSFSSIYVTDMAYISLLSKSNKLKFLYIKIGQNMTCTIDEVTSRLYLYFKVWFIKIRTIHKMKLWISPDKIIVPAPSIPHFKGLGIRNLQYESRICQKSHNTVTITVYI